jgi:CBS domain containing-hemolysin-like protein
MTEPFYLFLFTLLCIFVQGFFSMFEMASVSFNRVRLQYYEKQGHTMAIWLKELLSHPSRLFGTTLIMINLALLIGSEASRRLYESLGFDPDLAPITQVIFVLVFGELAPLFAARRHPEGVALFGTPIVMFLSKILMPIVWILEIVSYFLGKSKEKSFFLSREEVQKAFEESHGTMARSENEQMMCHIFSLRSKITKSFIQPLEAMKSFPHDMSVEKVVSEFRGVLPSFLPIYRENKENIVAISTPRDLLQSKKTDRIIERSHSPWFITDNFSILRILQEFRHNNQSIAVVLDGKGKTIGYLTLDEIIDEIFPDTKDEVVSQKIYVEKTLSGDTLLSDFNRQFHGHLYHEEAETLSDLMSEILHHLPEDGEMVYVGCYELTVMEASLLGAKTILVKTVF